MENSLYVYRASAGSGKTFTLAVEYIKLLIAHPTAYKHILAVTFTNKATAEMKERILGQLYGIGYSLESSKGYFDKIKEAFPKMEETELREHARKALHLILHDYGHFRIQTIDAFFQTILRGLAKELELSGDIEVTIDNTDLLNDTVELLIKDLTPTSVEMGWIVEYIEEGLDNDKSWRIHLAIKKFAENILKEEFQERGDKLRKQIESDNGALLADYRRTIKRVEQEITEKVKSLGKRFFEIAAANSLGMEDFLGGSRGLWSHFTKLANGTIAEISEKGYPQKCIDNPSKISKRLLPEEYNEIADLLQQNKNMLGHESKILNSCKLSLARFHQLRLLNSIAKKLREENIRENRFLLEQTTYLLSRMIDNDTSFIFEKIGAEIRHIFIDEFQDTSKLQWNCFKVLLHEVMSHGTFNMIVGDVKQSIYRWRNSDWNILNNIEQEFPNGTMQSYNTTKGNHTTNYRSERNIIEFNNALFKKIKETIVSTYSEQLGTRLKDLEKAYGDVEQLIPAHKKAGGYAEIRFIDNDNTNDAILKQLIETLRVLLKEKEVSPSDITILVRNRNVIAPIVETFNKELPEYGIISDEAYLLSSSAALNLLISAIRYILQPQDRLNTIEFITRYNSYILNKELPFTELLHTHDSYRKYIPEKLYNHTDELKEKPLNEIIEELITILGVDKIEGEEPFIYSFLDYVAQHTGNNGCNINNFLDTWENELSEKSISANDQDYVKIVTIHKSKGLEFHTVIIPFCTWGITGGLQDIIWCNPRQEPFNGLSLLPIDKSKKMLNSIYDNEYNHEFLFQLVDNLNLLYVACTRASHNLFIFSEAKGNAGTIGAPLSSCASQFPLDGAEYDTEKQILSFGVVASSKKEEKHNEENPFTTTPIKEEQAFVSYENSMESRQSHNLRRFLAKSNEEIKESEYMDTGELMHDIMSHLATGNELHKELIKKQIEGLIATDKERERIERLIEKALANPKASEWFSGKYTLFNEQSILYSENGRHHVFRPDRVMIADNETIVVDFKFAKPLPSHVTQVKNYMNSLALMGYKNIRGHLWYIYKNEIVDIK